MAMQKVGLVIICAGRISLAADLTPWQEGEEPSLLLSFQYRKYGAAENSSDYAIPISQRMGQLS